MWNCKFDVVLPEGVTASEDDFALSSGQSSSFTISHDTISSESPIRLRCMLFTVSTTYFVDGDLVELPIQIDSSITPGTELTATVTGDNREGFNPKYSMAGPDCGEFFQDDFTFTIRVVENQEVLDEQSTTVPEAVENTKVLVKRSINADTWSTICLPFALTETQAKSAFGNTVQVAEFTGAQSDYDANENITNLHVNFASKASVAMEANHPYLVKVPQAISYEDGFVVDNVSIAPAERPALDLDETSVKIQGRTYTYYNSFVGVYSKQTIGEPDVPVLFLSDKKFYAAKGSTTMKAFRAYFDLMDLALYLESNSAAKMSFMVDGETTSIDGLTPDAAGLGAVYDLMGRKVQEAGRDLKQLPKGIYIVNGQKISVK